MKPDNHICHPKRNSVSTFIAILLCIQILFAKTTYCQELTTRVSCIGNSITWGHGLPDRENNYYPAKLDKLLGAGWEVNNYAYWGRTVLRNGDFPYWNIPEFTAAIASNPDIIPILSQISLEMENYYLEDGVHPNLDGSTALASKFYDMLKPEQPQIEQVYNQLITAESAGY